jgi:hypothetical protein
MDFLGAESRRTLGRDALLISGVVASHVSLEGFFTVIRQEKRLLTAPLVYARSQDPSRSRSEGGRLDPLHHSANLPPRPYPPKIIDFAGGWS